MKKYEGMHVVTFGVFDLLHFGHFELFRRLKELVGKAGCVTVAIQEDAWVSKFKDVKLVYDWETRRSMVSALRAVDCVVPYTQVDDTIKHLEFDVAVFGPDQIHSGFQKAMQWCRDTGKEVVILNRTTGISSSQIREGGLR